MPSATAICPDHSNPLAGWRGPAGADDGPLRARLGACHPNGRRLLLVGPDDTRIRALVADWLSEHPADTVVLAAPLDVPLAERHPDVLLHRLGRAVATLTGLHEGNPLAPADLRRALPGRIARAGARGGAVLILEGVDERPGAPDWLPQYAPPTVTVVTTAAPGATADWLAAAGWQRIDVGAGRFSPEAEPAPVTARDEPLLRRLWASPEGVDDTTLDRLDPDGAGRRRCRRWLRRRPGGVALAGERLRRGLEARLPAAGGPRRRWLAALAADTDDPVAAGGWLVLAEAWTSLAARLSDPATLDSWPDAAPVLVTLWRRLPVPDTAWRGLGEALRRRRAGPPTEHEARRQLAAVSLLEALERDSDAAELRAAVVRWLAASGRAPAALAEALHRDGLAALQAGETEAAAERFAQSRRLRRRTFGPTSAEVLSSDHALAMVEESRGNTGEAERRYRALLTSAMERYGADHPRLIAPLSNLAAVQRAANRLEPARDNLDAALRIARKALGADHPTTASLQDSHAGLLYAGGDLQGAERGYREAAAVTERLFGRSHEATAASLHNLGTCLDTRGVYGEAEDCFRRALDVRRHLLGDYHADTASTRHNLAGVLDVTGRAVEAEAAYREALRAWEVVVGESHPATATTVNNLADLLREDGRYAEAEPLYRRNLRTWEVLYGVDHPNALMTAAELGTLCADAGRTDEAEALLVHAVEGLRRRLGVTGGLYIDAALRLARVQAARGRPADALSLLDETLKAAEGSTAILGARYQRLRRHREAIARSHAAEGDS